MSMVRFERTVAFHAVSRDINRLTPIRINLRGSKQKLISIGMLSPRVHAAANGQAARDVL